MTPSAAKNRLRSFELIAKHIRQGLDGTPFHWSNGQYRAFKPKAETMGFTLITRTGIEREGHQLKRTARPVGSAYLTAPIKKDVDLYVLEVACTQRALRKKTDNEDQS